MVTIYLVRHGYSVANDQKFFAGSSDVKLSAIGEQQAQLVSDYILNNLKIDKIYSSSLSRAYDTISKVGEGFNLPINKNTAFNEIYGGKWEMLTFEQILSNYYNDFICWKTNIYQSSCTGGESFKEVMTRSFNELKKIAQNNEDKNLLIATHAGVIRAIITSIKNLSAEECNSLGWVSNASLTTITYENEKFEIKQASYDEYLNGLSTSLPKNI
ncbi:MAG: histidine phosphatase family protein [Clostridia bacterium]|nr:histidine phosphatase family protein [Clostridia bacterium]